MSKRALTVIVSAAFLLTFGAGWVAGSTTTATTINRGLLTAVDSVGQNLFGTGVFSASLGTTEAGLPAVQLDLSTDAGVPTVVNLHPPNPNTDPLQCRDIGLQIQLTPATADEPAQTTVYYDPDSVQPVPAPPFPPSPCQPVG